MPLAASKRHHLAWYFTIQWVLLLVVVTLGLLAPPPNPRPPFLAPTSSDTVDPKVSCVFRQTCPPPGAFWI